MPKARQMREPQGSDPEKVYDRWAAESAAEVAAIAGMAAKELLERPTLIYVTPSGGRLFLGPLPTSNNRHLFGPITMQITCMGKSPEQRGGITLPGARLFQFELVPAMYIGMSCLESLHPTWHRRAALPCAPTGKVVIRLAGCATLERPVIGSRLSP